MDTKKVFLGLFLLALASSIDAAIDGTVYEDEITFYNEWAGNYGSCALEKSKTDPFRVAALSKTHMKKPEGVSNPNKHPLCGEEYCVKITGKRGSVVLKVSDTCGGCGEHGIDVADKVFPLLDDPGKGRVKMSWQFVDCRENPVGPV